MLLAVITLIMGVYVLLDSGILSGDILEAYQYRNENGYSIESAGGRTELWMMSIENLFLHPMGWKQESYAHNLWLDMAKIGGWISLFPFIIATVIVLRKLLLLFKNKCSLFAEGIFVLNLAVFLAAFIEPVIEGSMSFFLLLMFIWGMTVAISNENRGMTR